MNCHAMKRHKALRKAAGWWMNRLYDDRCIGISVQILRQTNSWVLWRRKLSLTDFMQEVLITIDQHTRSVFSSLVIL